MNIKTASTDNLKIIAYDLSESISLQQNNLNVIMTEIRTRAQQQPETAVGPEVKTVKKTVNVKEEK